MAGERESAGDEPAPGTAGPDADAADLGGGAPCYAPEVCAECGLLIEDRLANTCPRCGTDRG